MVIKEQKTKIYTVQFTKKEMEAVVYIARCAKGAPMSKEEEAIRDQLARVIGKLPGKE